MMMNTSKQERQAICLPKFTSTKKATSPLRFPQMEGYHEEPLASPIHHQGKLVLTKKKLHKGGAIQTIPGVPHGEGTQWVTPNRLEASFKSNKHESINQSHHKCFLRGGNEKLSQRG
jgi:hypothetical protein